jgi:hypothetical protein
VATDSFKRLHGHRADVLGFHPSQVGLDLREVLLAQVIQQHHPIRHMGNPQPAREDTATGPAAHVDGAVYGLLRACCHNQSSTSGLGGMRRSYATALRCSMSAVDSRTVHG